MAIFFGERIRVPKLADHLFFVLSISKIGIPSSFGSRSWLNFFSKRLLVKKLKSGALIGQKQVENERLPKEQGISILNIPGRLESI